MFVQAQRSWRESQNNIHVILHTLLKWVRQTRFVTFLLAYFSRLHSQVKQLVFSIDTHAHEARHICHAHLLLNGTFIQFDVIRDLGTAETALEILGSLVHSVSFLRQLSPMIVSRDLAKEVNSSPAPFDSTDLPWETPQRTGNLHRYSLAEDIILELATICLR